MFARCVPPVGRGGGGGLWGDYSMGVGLWTQGGEAGFDVGDPSLAAGVQAVGFGEGLEDGEGGGEMGARIGGTEHHEPHVAGDEITLPFDVAGVGLGEMGEDIKAMKSEVSAIAGCNGLRQPAEGASQ